MRHRRILVRGGVAAGLAIGCVSGGLLLRGGPPPAALASTPATSLTVICASPALGGTLPTAVYLPAGYRGSSARFPVIYFLHGLPAGPSTYREYGFVATAVARTRHPAIVVAPQGAREENSDREYLDWAPDENWPTAIAGDLTRCIDRRFRTIANRNGRALVGLSAGGFGAFNIGLRRLKTFSAVESWSGYFAATDPSGLVTLDLGSEQASRKARVPRGRHLRGRLTRLKTFIGFYVGRQDARFLQANIELDKQFTAHRIPHVFAIYPGGHDGSLWATWAPVWLGYALQRLSAPAG